jgi:glutathione S-transferase
LLTNAPVHIYHRKAAGRPIRIVWMLEEVGDPYDLTVMTIEEAAQDEHRERHPMGNVPVLADEDGLMLFESSALCLHVADCHPEAGLIPEVGTRERALVYQWAFFAMTEIEPPVIQAFRLRESAPEVAEGGASRARDTVAAIEAALQGRDHLVGEGFSVADLIVSEVIRVSARLKVLEPEGGVADYLAAMEARPARQRAVARLA